jgi:two-component system, LuxR family, sensor kinase FixL
VLTVDQASGASDVTTMTQMTSNKTPQEILRLVAEATAPVTGDEFFRALMKKLATALGVRWAFITECLDYPTTRVRILAWWAGEGFGENIEFDLEGTPCEAVIKEGKVCFHPTDVGKHFPADRYITDMEGYIGIPIVQPSTGKVIGHIAIFDDKEMSDAMLVESMFRIFAVRAASELERLHTSEALRASEEKYRLLVENQTDLLVKLDSKGRLLFVSPSYCALFGVSEAEATGAPFLLSVHEDDHAATRQAWSALFQPPHNARVRQRAKTVKGWRWLSWNAKAVLDDNKDVREIVATARDVTEQRQAEEVVRLVAEATAPVTGEEFFRSLMRKLAGALNVRSAFITECLDYPPTRVRILAYWRAGGFIEPREFDLRDSPCEIVVGQGKICYYPQDVAKYFPNDRGLIDLKSYIGVPIFDSSESKVIGHIAIFNDKEMDDELLVESIFRIFAARAGAELQRMQTAEALRASEEKYRLLVENQNDLVVRLDGQGQLNFVSPSYCELFGQSEAQLLGTRFEPLLSDGNQSQPTDAWQKLFRPPHSCHTESRVLTTQGWRWIAWAAKASLDSQERVSGIVAVGRDVTEQKRAEEQARHHMNELAHVSRLSAMGEMASALAHEINQPLASILTYAQATLRLLENGEPGELRHAIKRVIKNTERAGDIVRHLRDFVRKGEPQRTLVKVNYLVREVVRLTAAEARQSGIQVTLDMANNLEAIHVDNIQLQQVLYNLLRNAMEAINTGNGDKRELSIRALQNSDDCVEIAVSDSGPGIPAAIADRLFQPFVTSKPHGMGIGLSISRSIIDAHGGRIWATANPDRGTTFHIKLPIRSENDGADI